MSYINLLQRLAQSQNSEQTYGCYRPDAIRALAQPDMSKLLIQNSLKSKEPQTEAGNELDLLSKAVQAGTTQLFPHADQACDPLNFDRSYRNALASCNLFDAQKQISNLNTLATRIDIAAKLAGLESKQLNAESVLNSDSKLLQKEWANFHEMSQQLAKNLSVDISRVTVRAEWQTAIQQLNLSALPLLIACHTEKAANVEPGQAHRQNFSGA